jgi:hypothetical protein
MEGPTRRWVGLFLLLEREVHLRFFTTLLLLASLALGCGGNEGPKGKNSGLDRPKATAGEK